MAVPNAGQSNPSRNEIIVEPRLIMIGLLDSKPEESTECREDGKPG